MKLEKEEYDWKEEEEQERKTRQMGRGGWKRWLGEWGEEWRQIEEGNIEEECLGGDGGGMGRREMEEENKMDAEKEEKDDQ